MVRIAMSPRTRVMAAVVASAAFVFGARAGFADDTPAAATTPPGYAEPSRLAQSSLLLSVAHAGSRLVAVGEFGHVILSDDGGATWRQAQSVPTTVTLTSVVFVDDKTGWAVGHDTTILQTKDGGETWAKQFDFEIATARNLQLPPRETPAAELPSGSEGADYETDDGGDVSGAYGGTQTAADIPFLTVVFVSPTRGFAMGGFNYAVETNDAGQTWVPRRLVATAEDDYHLNGSFKGPGNSVFAATEFGQVYRSLDGGTTWEIVKTAYDGSFWGGFSLKDGSVILTGMRGNIWRSTDLGATWTQIGAGSTPESLAGGTQLDDGMIVFAGLGGAVVYTTDNGATFKDASRPDRRGNADVAQGPDGKILLFGEAGVVTQDEPKS